MSSMGYVDKYRYLCTVYILYIIYHNMIFITWHYCIDYILENPPAPKVLGRDLPDGTRKRLQVYLGGGIFRPKPPVFDRS